MTDEPAPKVETPKVPAPKVAGPKSANPAAEHRGPIRNFLESAAMAVLMAVMLKYFALEAYVIPTPSMQPTMMGSPEAGESDRILVDKLYYLLHDPKRWDIAVFRYPVRQVQSYVKRIVGVGGDKLKIAGGNLYNVVDGKPQILRKPERIQRTLWREVYPMRWRLSELKAGRDAWAAPKHVQIFGPGKHLRSLAGKWSIDADGNFQAQPQSGALQLQVDPSNALNNYSDGYDLEVAKQLAEDQGAMNAGDEVCQDLAIAFDITPSKTPEQVIVSIDVTKPAHRFSLKIDNGEAVLEALRVGDKKTLTSDKFPVALSSGTATHLRFERLDDQLHAYVDGDRVMTLDAAELPILEDIDRGRLVARVNTRGTGNCTFGEFRVLRDLHYIRGVIGKNELIEVPAGHFFMMGDNTRGSADGRDWTAIKIGVDEQGRVVDPTKPEHKNARVLWGNRRPNAFTGGRPVHDDDNPVPLLYEDRVVFVDAMGQIHPLKGKVDKGSWGKNPAISFAGVAPNEKDWEPESRPARFVPRAHIQGRPVARFLRSVGSFKITGWIR